MRIDKFSKWLKGAAPVLHRALRGPWQYIQPYVPVENTYWAERKDFRYYEEVVRFARHHVPQGGRVIDVGAGATKLLERMKWFDERVRLDQSEIPSRRGIEQIHLDFFEYRPLHDFDLVLCLQVLEHLDDPGAFAQKLFAIGRNVIISVPYKWPKGAHPPHVQDPVDEAKLEAWTGRKPAEMCIVHDGADRLIAVYRGPFTA